MHAVTFNYRGNPLVQQAREMIAGGELGAGALRPRRVSAGLAAGADRLLLAARAGQRRRELRGRRHRIALVRSRAARHRPAHRRGPRRSDDGDRHAAQAVGVDRGVRAAAATARASRSRSAARISRRSSCASTAARRAACRSARSAPATRTACGSRSTAAARRCAGCRSGRTSCGSAAATRANGMLLKDPSLLAPGRARLRAPARRASGRLGRRVLQRDARHLRRSLPPASAPADPRPPAFATFEDGYHSACVVDAMLESHRAAAVWTKVGARSNDRLAGRSMKLGLFTPVFGKLTSKDDAREGAGAGEGAGDRARHRRLAGPRSPRRRRAARQQAVRAPSTAR